MANLKSIQVALPTRDVKGTAKFYAAVFGFRLQEEGAHRVTLVQGELRLSLMQAEPGSAALQPIHLRMTVGDPQQLGEILQRVKGQGSAVLEESSDQSSFVCLGPDDYPIEVVLERPQPQVAQQPIASPPPQATEPPVPSPPQVETSPAKPAAAPSVALPPTPPPAPPPSGKPTRADRYMLEAEDQLARIKEEMADLTTSFKSGGIASTIDEMKEKISRRVEGMIKKATEPTEEELEKEKARRQAEEILARYKEQAQQKIEREEKAEDEGLKPVKKTLGPG
jgi:predicted enzyme related to lactoylglutathione lyase